ncbi:hypothetical protein M9H77_31033 [Catharanthus roseus]|uniref:Uncharacterized protein n=1 Tax=Catharanthus roseus TaxID=4058 RepID=A0ACB9ZZC0_CATRO|nr:hypothetical protein M9H77_31033 [Catharanthus roseus]
MLYHQKTEKQQYITRKSKEQQNGVGTANGAAERPRPNGTEQQRETATASRRRRKKVSALMGKGTLRQWPQNRTRKSPMFSLSLTLIAHPYKKTRDDRTKIIARRPPSEKASQKTQRGLIHLHLEKGKKYGLEPDIAEEGLQFYISQSQSITHLR